MDANFLLTQWQICPPSMSNPPSLCSNPGSNRTRPPRKTNKCRPTRCNVSLTLSHRLGGAIVTFRIGRKASKDFVVHEGSIAPGSEFVRLALRGDWKEVKERIIPLPEDDPEVFAVYQQWLYHGRICTSTTDFEPGTMDEYELLVHAYILGDKFVDVGFKDCVTDAILEKLLKQTHFSLRLTDDRTRLSDACGWTSTTGQGAPIGLMRTLWDSPSISTSWQSSAASRCGSVSVSHHVLSRLLATITSIGRESAISKAKSGRLGS
jgi:hypothetical protein